MLYDLLEDDEHLEALVGRMFGPDMQATGGVTKIFKGGGGGGGGGGGSLHKGVGVATDRRAIFLDKGILSTEVAEMPYASIESTSYSTGIIHAPA